MTAEATDKVNISSSFYKYRDDISFYEHSRGKTITFMIQLDDIPWSIYQEYLATWRNSGKYPDNTSDHTCYKIAMLTLSVEILIRLRAYRDAETIEGLEGLHHVKTLAENNKKVTFESLYNSRNGG